MGGKHQKPMGLGEIRAGGSLGGKGLGEGDRAVGRPAGYVGVCVFLWEEKVDSRCPRAIRAVGVRSTPRGREWSRGEITQEVCTCSEITFQETKRTEIQGCGSGFLLPRA